MALLTLLDLAPHSCARQGDILPPDASACGQAVEDLLDLAVAMLHLSRARHVSGRGGTAGWCDSIDGVNEGEAAGSIGSFS